MLQSGFRSCYCVEAGVILPAGRAVGSPANQDLAGVVKHAVHFAG